MSSRRSLSVCGEEDTQRFQTPPSARTLGFDSRHTHHSGFKRPWALSLKQLHEGSTPSSGFTRRLVVEEQTRQAENLFYASGVRVRFPPSRLYPGGGTADALRSDRSDPVIVQV